MAIGLSGLGIAGGVVYLVYLAEKLINLAKGVSLMIAELIVEKYKQRRRGKPGVEKGCEKDGKSGGTWYERQQAALREGRPFTELPPGYSDETHDNGKESP